MARGFVGGAPARATGPLGTTGGGLDGEGAPERLIREHFEGTSFCRTHVALNLVAVIDCHRLSSAVFAPAGAGA